ncbi:hypothetical protein AURANDRAFT_65118 [Aureococcus anophagefferens]|uniref:RING-type E3 ubiquitin transferase n=1 Tax=Aureococcus anophagefferens TaxID=44056 RepID=F0YCR7_AURAN|nr:hypothetical protein AURANDRAFT_65118 [Aureococcus anophagefferens]EGB06936.1 hypothetical protein AURANDRAFT_65118 [Aureococcus anophagefferens]|eukprot:XP_009038178.1 hypothetical protein AURANDRAFT_65118 [Aureococcus anophagefferens]
MACRVWLADPAEFEAQPAGFGKRPGPPTGEERDLAASAAALWNALASDAAPRYADDPEALGRLTARVLGEDGLLRLDGAACCAALREDAREGVVRWRHCAAAAAAAAAAESERDVRRLVDDGLVGSLVRVLTECEVPPEPYGGGHLLRIFACEALARVVAKSDAFSGDAAVISERQLDAVLALFENLHCVDGGDQSTAACRAFARAAFPELDAPVTSVVCRLGRTLLGRGRAALAGRHLGQMSWAAQALLDGAPRDPDADAEDAAERRRTIWVPDAAAILDLLARGGHAAWFLDAERLLEEAPRSLIGRLAPFAAPVATTRDAQTAIDIALQLRAARNSNLQPDFNVGVIERLRDQSGSSSKPSNWTRFQELAADFASRSRDNVAGIERGCLAGHARAALVPLVVAAASNPGKVPDGALFRDVLEAIDVFAVDLSEGRAQSAEAVAALARSRAGKESDMPNARSDVYARSAARALLPRVADLVCCGAEEEPQFRTKAMECLAKATAAWARDDAARPLAAACLRRVRRSLGAESPAAARAWKVAFDALPGELDVYERDVVALSLAADVRAARPDDERAARDACLRLCPQSYEDLLTHRAEFLPMDKVERIVEGGALDALVRVVASDGKAKKRATRNRRAALVCAAHDALVCILLAAREAYIERGHVNELVPWLDSGRDKGATFPTLDSRDATVALQTVALPLFDGAERTPPPPFAPASVGPAARMACVARSLVLLDCVYAISKARDAGWPRVHFDHELGVTAQKILELLPTLVAGERAPLGPAFHLLFDLGLGGHVGSTEDEAASKSLVDLLASARPIEDLGVAEEDRVEAALRKSQRPPPRDVPILLRHAATVALLIFAEGRGGENAWLADICAHGGVPRLLDIVRKDFLLSREGNAENARRAAMHLLRLAAKSAIARPALLRALGDVDARFVTTNVDEDALLEHLDIIQDAAAARYAAYERRRRKLGRDGDGAVSPAATARAQADADAAAASLLADCAAEEEGKASRKARRKKKKARKPPDAAIAAPAAAPAAGASAPPGDPPAPPPAAAATPEASDAGPDADAPGAAADAAECSSPDSSSAPERFDGDDALGAVLRAAGLGKDDRTRRILDAEGVDAAGFFLLRDRDVADLGVRKGAALKIRKHVNDRRAARSRDLDDDAPDFLTCPLSLELFVDPVLLLVDGQTYERSDVAAWIDQHATSPLTREPAKQADLVPNRAVLDAADAFRDGWGRLDEG